MRNVLAGALGALFIGACAGGAVPGLMMTEVAPSVTAGSPHIVAAVADARRPAADRERDALRHPAEIMAFAGVEPGWRVADIGPGAGYYSRLFAVAVGDTGRVYAIDRPGTAERPRAMVAVAPSYPNITHVMEGYGALSVGSEPLDAVFISQIYHDFFYPQIGMDVPAFNRAVFDALRPGGVYVIIDHAAAAGSQIDLNPQTSLHRIDEAQVIREVTAAGFVLEDTSPILRNPADNRALRVFEGDIRGHTDQFVLRFRKPAN